MTSSLSHCTFVLFLSLFSLSLRAKSLRWLRCCDIVFVFLSSLVFLRLLTRATACIKSEIGAAPVRLFYVRTFAYGSHLTVCIAGASSPLKAQDSQSSGHVPRTMKKQRKRRLQLKDPIERLGLTLLGQQIFGMEKGIYVIALKFFPLLQVALIAEGY